MDETFTWFSLSVAHACMGETNSSRMEVGWALEGVDMVEVMHHLTSLSHEVHVTRTRRRKDIKTGRPWCS